eukprot:1013411-Rhodomonas_salina.2
MKGICVRCWYKAYGGCAVLGLISRWSHRLHWQPTRRSLRAPRYRCSAWYYVTYAACYPATRCVVHFTASDIFAYAWRGHGTETPKTLQNQNTRTRLPGAENA